MTISRILLAVDDSEFSVQAANAANGLAKTLNAHVAIITVIDPALVAIGADTVVYPIEQMGELKEAAEKLIATVKGRLDASVTTDDFIAEGKPSDEIVFVANKWGADLIIIGTHGRTGLKHLIMGSVAENVIRHSKVPVLVIPSKGDN